MAGAQEKELSDFQTDVLDDVKEPSLYRVLMLNDDYTPMDFVVLVLQKFFHKTHDEAAEITLNVHQKGAGLCGIYPKDVAETKVDGVMNYAREHQHPLQCQYEKDSV